MSKLILNITEEGRGGGAMGRMRMVAKALKPNFETIIVFPSNAKSYKKSLQQSDIRFEEVMMHPLTKSWKGAFKYILFFWVEIYLLRRVIKKYDPALIQANGCWQIKGVIAGKMTGKKVLWYMNDSFQPSIILRLFKYISKHAFAFGYASHRTQKYYEKASPKIQEKRSSVISAPVNIEKIDFVKRARSKGIRFLTIGYINIHKGLELLIQTAAKTTDLNITFDVVGPVIDSQKKYMDTLLTLMKSLEVSNVRFLGYRSITTELMAEYDYYLCSSIREASPMAVWEAMASGLPIVSTDVGDVKAVVLSEQCGAIVDELNANVMAQAVRRILQVDDSSYKKMAEQARATAIKFFSVDKVSKDYLRFYTELISEPSN